MPNPSLCFPPSFPRNLYATTRDTIIYESFPINFSRLHSRVMISSKFRACFSDVTRPRMHLIFLDFPRETLTSRRGWRFVVSQRLETTNPHSLRGRNRATGIYVAGYFSRASRERGNFGRIPFDRLFSRFSCLVSSENLQTSSIAFFDGTFS